VFLKLLMRNHWVCNAVTERHNYYVADANLQHENL